MPMLPPWTSTNNLNKQTSNPWTSRNNFYKKKTNKTNKQNALWASTNNSNKQVSNQTRNFSRSVYSLLDYLGDVGGLLDGLKLIASTLIAPVGGYNYITLLLTKLFSVQSKREKFQEAPHHHSTHQTVYSTCSRANQEIKERRQFKEKFGADLMAYLICCLGKSSRR